MVKIRVLPIKWPRHFATLRWTWQYQYIKCLLQDVYLFGFVGNLNNFELKRRNEWDATTNCFGDGPPSRSASVEFQSKCFKNCSYNIYDRRTGSAIGTETVVPPDKVIHSGNIVRLDQVWNYPDFTPRTLERLDWWSHYPCSSKSKQIRWEWTRLDVWSDQTMVVENVFFLEGATSSSKFGSRQGMVNGPTIWRVWSFHKATRTACQDVRPFR
jgi:hypothetical protein